MRILTLSTCLLVSIALTCGTSKADLRGRLVYGSGNSIYEVHFPSGDRERVYKFPRGTIVQSLTHVGDRRILFSTDAESDVLELDLETRALRKLFSGSGPAYIAEHGKIFFYERPEGAQNAYLYVTDLDDPMGTRREVDRGPFVAGEPVIQVSRDEVVFSSLSPELAGPAASVQGLGKYNIVTGEKVRVPVGYCNPRVWRSATKELLCQDTLNRREYFTDLKGREREASSDWEFQPVLYIPSRDAILGVRGRFKFGVGELWDLYLWQFKENKASLLLENTTAYLGVVAWFE